MLTISVPPGYARDDGRLPVPDLGETPQITLESWRVDTDGPATLVGACFGGRAGAWLPEADEVALQKLASMTLSTALRAGVEPNMRPVAEAREGSVRTQTLAGEGLRAKTFLGFEPGGAVHGCFALCLRSASCEGAVDGSSLEGTLVEPPAPGLAGRALAWAVHHPRDAAATIAGVFVLGGILAILTRRRPRVST